MLKHVETIYTKHSQHHLQPIWCWLMLHSPPRHPSSFIHRFIGSEDPRSGRICISTQFQNGPKTSQSSFQSSKSSRSHSEIISHFETWKFNLFKNTSSVITHHHGCISGFHMVPLFSEVFQRFAFHPPWNYGPQPPNAPGQRSNPCAEGNRCCPHPWLKCMIIIHN